MVEKQQVELSVVIPALNEGDNLLGLLPQIHRSLEKVLQNRVYEIVIVDGGSKDNTREISRELGARVVMQTKSGYGNALVDGFKSAVGEYILTMDSDLSHSPEFVAVMWEARRKADIVIASRYIVGGYAKMPLARKILSRILNIVFTKGLSLPCRDISSGFRLYRAEVVKRLSLKSTDFDILEELFIKCYISGVSFLEVPFTYVPRRKGQSHVRLWKFGIAFLKTFHRMWKLRLAPPRRREIK